MTINNKSNLLKIVSIGLATYLLSGCIIHVGSGNAKTANVEIEDTLALNAEDIQRLTIDAGAGSMQVIGVEGANEIIVEADILTTEDRNYQLSLEKQGSDAKLVAKSGYRSGSWYKSPKIDIKVSVPANLMLDVDDSSGDILIENIANKVFVDDSSGAIVMRNIGGDTVIDDSSGNINIAGVDGKLVVDDTSGNISVLNTNGDVNIEDGSGDIKVVETAGVVTIDDGSGDINVERANGLTIIDDGSGKTRISEVSGNITTSG